MATYHEAPEVATQYQAPEVYHQPQQAAYQNQAASQAEYGQSPQSGYIKQDVVGSPHSQAAAVEGGPPYGAVHDEKSAARTICGCGMVLFLTIIIALLTIAVVALAAVTGVESGKANSANNALAAKVAADATLSPTATVFVTGTGTAASAIATSTGCLVAAASIDDGCLQNPSVVNGTIYTTPFSNNANFTRYCNVDTPNGPLLSVVALDFKGCMDTCAAWNVSPNVTLACEAVSFIPAWSNRTFAIAGGAAGDCYLKPGPITKNTLTVANAGTPVNAAILILQDKSG